MREEKRREKQDLNEKRGYEKGEAKEVDREENWGVERWGAN